MIFFFFKIWLLFLFLELSEAKADLGETAESTAAASRSLVSKQESQVKIHVWFLGSLIFLSDQKKIEKENTGKRVEHRTNFESTSYALFFPKILLTRTSRLSKKN